MNVSDCVRMSLGKARKMHNELAAYLGLSSPQVLQKKYERDSWTAKDLIKVAKFTGGELMIVYPDGQQIKIVKDDEGEAKE